MKLLTMKHRTLTYRWRYLYFNRRIEYSVLTHQMAKPGMKPNSFISEKKYPYLYMKVSLTLDVEDASQLTSFQYKYLFMKALKKALRQVSAKNMVLLKLSKKGEALIRLTTRDAEKFFAALTMYRTKPAMRRCGLRVLQVSPSLTGIAWFMKALMMHCMTV